MKRSVPGSEAITEDEVRAWPFWQKKVEIIGSTLWKNTESRTRMIFFNTAFVDAIKRDSNE